ncbi:MAG: hypothetical protein C0432_04500 [Candidatus Puniceispirillum sp.]|nr:hypothetical protein [Candidatus Pelagibacter sp.]MBA4283536.1 hypothetical protein [Candidatus Puniceispirillum sp.]
MQTFKTISLSFLLLCISFYCSFSSNNPEPSQKDKVYTSCQRIDNSAQYLNSHFSKSDEITKLGIQLLRAAQNGDTNSVIEIINRVKDDTNLWTSQDHFLNSGWVDSVCTSKFETPFFLALKYGHQEIAKILKSHFAKNEYDAGGSTINIRKKITDLIKNKINVLKNRILNSQGSFMSFRFTDTEITDIHSFGFNPDWCVTSTEQKFLKAKEDSRVCHLKTKQARKFDTQVYGEYHVPCDHIQKENDKNNAEREKNEQRLQKDLYDSCFQSKISKTTNPDGSQTLLAEQSCWHILKDCIFDFIAKSEQKIIKNRIKMRSKAR